MTTLVERIQHLQNYIYAFMPTERETFNKLVTEEFKLKGKLNLGEIISDIVFTLSKFDYDTDLCQDLVPEAPFDYDYFFTSFDDFKEAIGHCKDPEAEVIIHNLIWIRVNNIKEVLLAGI